MFIIELRIEIGISVHIYFYGPAGFRFRREQNAQPHANERRQNNHRFEERPENQIGPFAPPQLARFEARPEIPVDLAVPEQPLPEQLRPRQEFDIPPVAQVDPFLLPEQPQNERQIRPDELADGQLIGPFALPEPPQNQPEIQPDEQAVAQLVLNREVRPESPHVVPHGELNARPNLPRPRPARVQDGRPRTHRESREQFYANINRLVSESTRSKYHNAATDTFNEFLFQWENDQ